eukprot:gene7696-7895_t
MALSPGIAGAVVVKAHEEDEVLPIWSGRIRPADAEKVGAKAPKLGGATLGEELSLMQQAYERKERDVENDMQKHLYTNNWQGDVYVGSNVNILTVIMGLTIAIPLLGLLFAYLSYGTLWLGHYYGI